MPDLMKMGGQPNYLGSWDVEDTAAKALTLTIKTIRDEDVVGDGGRKEICTVCHWNEEYKPMILNLTNKKRIFKLYKTKETEKLVGKRVTIVTEKVHAFGDVFDALRIKPVVPPAVSSAKILCEECGNYITPTQSMTVEQIANGTKAKYGKTLCARCGSEYYKRLAAEKAEKTEKAEQENNE